MQYFIVEFPADLKFQRAERIVDVLKTVANAVSKVINRIDAILVSCSWMTLLFNSINNRVS